MKPAQRRAGWLSVFVWSAATTLPSLAADRPANLSRGDAFEIVSHVFAAGGDSSADGGCVRLSGTMGEAVVGRATGGDFVVTAGFRATTPSDDIIFENGFQNEVCAP